MKRKFLKIINLSCVFSVIISSLIGCSNTESEKSNSTNSKEINLTVVLKSTNGDYWNMVEAGANDAANSLGVKVKIMGPKDESEIAAQTAMMEENISNKSSALVVAAIQPTTAMPTLESANKEGIPVVLIDTNINWDKKVTFVGTNNTAGGGQAGKYIAGKLKSGDKVAIVRGAFGDVTHDERSKGAEDAMKAAGLNILNSLPADSNKNRAIDIVTNLMQINPDIRAIFCTNDEMALGASAALSKLGKSGIIVVGFDGSAEALKAIKVGNLNATIMQNAYNIGKMGVEVAVKKIRGISVDSVIDTGTTVVDTATVDNARAELDKVLKN